jgi:hypothetical protein
MLDVITVPFSHLVLRYRNIGVHRGRTWGFRDVFGFQTLRDLPFVELASKVRDAYEERDVPSHEGWPAQREALRWLVDKGRDGIYALDQGEIEVRRVSDRSAADEQGSAALPRVGSGASGATDEQQSLRQEDAAPPLSSRYYIFDGHHRALALFVLGDHEVRARINGGAWSSRRRDDSGADSDVLAPHVERDRDPR